LPRRANISGVVALGLGLLLGPAGAAAQLQVSPVQVELTSKEKAVLVALHNLSDAPVRYQVTAFAWSQDAQGEMKLSRTKDVLFFPGLLTVGAKETRNLRVAAAGPFGAVEKTYRVFVEQLPDRTPSTGVRVLTRVGIPVFFAPRQPEVRAEATALALAGRRLSFVLRNTGTIRIRPDLVRVVGRDADGATVFEEKLSCWYVLAGGERAFELQLPAGSCTRARSVTAEITLPTGKVEAALPTPSGACGS
jgi:fimbrial chaperone protein